MNLSFTSTSTLALLAIAVLLSAVSEGAAQGPTQESFREHLLYVKVRPETDVRDRERLRRKLSSGRLEIVDVQTFGSPSMPEPVFTDISGNPGDRRIVAEYLLSRLMVVRYSGQLHPLQAAQLLAAVDIVLVAEPVPVSRPFGGGTPETPNDPRIPDQKQLSTIRAEEAWQIESGDTGVVVGVVDAGMTARHEDLWDNIAVNWGEAGLDQSGNARETNGIDDDGNGYVDDWKGVNLTPGDEILPGETTNGEHGTQVSGYVGATTDNGLGIAGVANQCRFFPIKGAQFRSSAMVGGYNGILYAARRGFQVVNCSWGQPVSSIVEQEIVDLAVYGYDIAIVAAGGNDGGYLRYFPAGYRNVLGVGGINDLQSVVTAWGEHIDVVARAGLTTSDLNQYFDLSSASSYAAPVVSGIVALVRSHWPELSAQGALQHVRLTAVPIDNFNLGREGFVGRGKADALNALSSDPYAAPGLVIDSVWAVDATGNRTDSLREGEVGEIHLSVTNLFGPASNARVRATLYTDDTSSIAFAIDTLAIGELETGGTWISTTGIPVAISGPGRRAVSIRFELIADDYFDRVYEFVPLRRTYTVLRGEKIVLTISDNGKPAVDYSEGTPVGEGVTWNGMQMIYEAGLVVATDRQHLLDNIRTGNPAQPNDDLRPISPGLFPVAVTAAVDDRDVQPDHIGLRIGTRGELFEDLPDLMRIGLFVENRSGRTIDSLRLALFADWDLDGASEGQRVDTIDPAALNGSIYPVIGRISSGVISTAFVALEQGERDPFDSIAPLYYAILNGGDPLVIFDGFADEEKYRTISNGIGNPTAGPGDISLVIGGVISDLQPGEVDSLFILAAFSDRSEIPQSMRDYTEEVYGRSSVAGPIVHRRDRTDISPNPASTFATVRGEGIRSISVVGRRGRTLFVQSVPIGAGALSIPTSGLPSGTYRILIHRVDGNESIPFIVIH